MVPAKPRELQNKQNSQYRQVRQVRHLSIYYKSARKDSKNICAQAAGIQHHRTREHWSVDPACHAVDMGSEQGDRHEREITGPEVLAAARVHCAMTDVSTTETG